MKRLTRFSRGDTTVSPRPDAVTRASGRSAARPRPQVAAPTSRGRLGLAPALAALALFVGAAGCEEDEPSEISYTVSYVNGGESLANVKHGEIVLDGREATRQDEALAVGGGSFRASPRGDEGYDFELFDADGTSLKRITCDASDVSSGSKTFEAPLAAGGSYGLFIALTRARCSEAR